MQKIKNKNKILMLALFFVIGIIFSTNMVFAYDTSTNVVLWDGNGAVLSGSNVTVTVRQENTYPGWAFLKYVAPRPEYVITPGYTDFDGNWIPPVMRDAVAASCIPNSDDPNLDPTGLVLSPNPTNGFCSAMATCSGASSVESIVPCTTVQECAAIDVCVKIQADAYNSKIIAAQNKAFDDLVSAAGLDSSSTSGVFITCKADLTCINLALRSLGGTGNFDKKNATSDPNGALTLTQLQGLMNDDGNIPTTDVQINAVDAGILNSANNQGSITNKQSDPQVDVVFSADSYKQGSIVSAEAVPSFFNNNSDAKDLYFTWYLKHVGCENGKDVSGSDAATIALKIKCDLDDNDKINENDWKIAATRILVRGGFDSTGVSYSASTVDSGFTATPSPISKWDGTHTDNVQNCYVKESVSGLTYELRDVSDTFNDSCPDGYDRACAKDSTPISCNVLNPTYSQQEANTNSDYAISKTKTESVGTPCVVSWSSSQESTEQQNCEIADGSEGLTNYRTKVICEGGEAAICVKTQSSTILDTLFPENASNNLPLKGIVFANAPTENNLCGLIFKPNSNTSLPLVVNPPILLEEKNSMYSSFETGGCEATGIKMTDSVNGNAELKPTCGFVKSTNRCKHLFPKVPGETTGDGSFTLAEKKFWGLNPNAASTNSSGKNDEEVVTGLGMNQFRWMYSVGDQLGLVVEGDSVFASDHADSSHKRMWAFSKGTCKSLTKSLKKKDAIGFYTEGTESARRGFFTTTFDVNDCLEENLLNPDENDPSKLTVELTASPADPINDENGGDVLTVSANQANVENLNGLMYEWSVQKSNIEPIDNTIWKDITEDITGDARTEKSFTAAALTGLGKDKLAINLNIAKDVLEDNSGNLASFFYLRIKVKIQGSLIDGSQNAQGAVVVRVRQQKNKIEVFPVEATSTGALLLKRDGDPFCVNEDGKQTEICYVTKNQIVGVTIPSNSSNNTTKFLWSINDADIVCDASISEQCSNSSSLVGKTLFFPILGNEGEAVVVTAAGLGVNGELIEVSRRFVIGSYQLQIKPAMSNYSIPCGDACLIDNNACPKYLGKYIDLVNPAASTLDCSEEVWQTSAGKTVLLQATTSGEGLEWAIDGQLRSEYSDQQQIELPIEKNTGESYNIALSNYITPQKVTEINNLRRALYLHWGVPPAESVEDNENQSTSLQLEVIDNPGAAISTAKSNIFSASLITHLPEQMIFLLKISLTSIMIFLITGLLFAFMPKKLFKEEEVV